MMQSAKEFPWLAVLTIIIKALPSVLFAGGVYGLNHSVIAFTD